LGVASRQLPSLNHTTQSSIEAQLDLVPISALQAPDITLQAIDEETNQKCRYG
jgi:hypothetical protein